MKTNADASAAARQRNPITELILEIFRANGALLAAGDALVGDLALTSARWQVLGAIAFAPVPLPVAHLARNMGLTRQAVQRSIDEMRADGLVRTEPNPHHRRAVLVVMTDQGEAAFCAAAERQRRWASGLATGLSPADIAAAAALLRLVRQRLDRTGAAPVAAAASNVKEDA